MTTRDGDPARDQLMRLEKELAAERTLSAESGTLDSFSAKVWSRNSVISRWLGQTARQSYSALQTIRAIHVPWSARCRPAQAGSIRLPGTSSPPTDIQLAGSSNSPWTSRPLRRQR